MEKKIKQKNNKIKNNISKKSDKIGKLMEKDTNGKIKHKRISKDMYVREIER